MQAQGRCTARGTDERCPQHASKDTSVGNGEGVASDVIHGQLILLREVGELGEFGLHLCQILGLQVFDHRRHQALRRSRGKANVDVVPVNDLVARVVNVGVQRRDLLQCISTSQKEG